MAGRLLGNGGGGLGFMFWRVGRLILVWINPLSAFRRGP